MSAFVITSKTFTNGKMAGTSISNDSHSKPESLVDASWELVDPCPDIHALFIQFNDRFFGGSLAGCEVRWSPRMTLCAGQCHYEGRGGLCSVRLSTPLLKLRPRKDLVETLLHEMIHAYLFVTERNTDHDGHGPNFQKHMARINAAAGTNITIYHSFHAEVALYKQHWWRCNGPCRNRKPYYGWVKRATNRAPSKNDFWWADHQKNCGGIYEKVKEPEGYGEKKNKKAASSQKAKSQGASSEGMPGTSKRKTEDKKGQATSPSKQPKIEEFLGKGTVLGGSASVSRFISQDTKTTNVKKSISATERDAKPLPKKQLILAGFKTNSFPKVGAIPDSVRNPMKTEASTNYTKGISGGPFPSSSKTQSDTTDSFSQFPVDPITINDDSVECPNCSMKVSLTSVNAHLDACLS